MCLVIQLTHESGIDWAAAWCHSWRNGWRQPLAFLWIIRHHLRYLELENCCTLSIMVLKVCEFWSEAAAATLCNLFTMTLYSPLADLTKGTSFTGLELAGPSLSVPKKEGESYLIMFMLSDCEFQMGDLVLEKKRQREKEGAYVYNGILITCL